MSGDTTTSGTISTSPLLRARRVTGSLSAVSTLTVPGLTRLIDLLGTTTGTSTITSTLARTRGLIGSESGASSLSGGIVRLRGIDGSVITAADINSAVLKRDLASLQGLLAGFSEFSGVIGKGVLFSSNLEAYATLAAQQLTRMVPIEGSSTSHSDMVASSLAVILAFVGDVASQSTLSAALRKIAAYNGALNGAATLTASTIRIVDGLTQLTVQASWETWERVDDSVAMLVQHTTEPYTFSTRFDLPGLVVDGVSIESLVKETN